MKKTTALIIATLALVSTTAGLNLQIDAKEKFELNDTIQANYTINVDEAKEVSYISSFQCSTIPIGFPQRNTVQVPEEGYTNTKVLVNVTDRYSSQNCNFSVSTTSPGEITRQKTLKIETDPKIDFELLLCTDEDCNNQSKTFQKGKTVYIDYSSNVDTPKVTGEITEPGGNQIDINPPQQIELTEKGTYSAEIKSEKQGYRSTVENTSFAAIEEYSLNDTNETSEVYEEPKNESGNTLTIAALLIGFLALILGLKKLI